MSTSWVVQTLSPVGKLTGLRYLSIANLKAKDRSLAPLFSLTHLETFHHATWWAANELSEMRRRNRALGA